MGRRAAEQEPDVKQLWLTAEKASGQPLREIYWDGGAEDMARTEALQPAMAVVGLGLWMIASRNLSPRAAAGHSLGEYTALAAAKALAPEDMLELVSLRGRLMAEAGAEDDGMAAILKLEMATVEEITQQAAADAGELALVANYNSPAQFVVSGKKPAIDKIAEAAKDRKGRAVPLPVSGAFHSPLVREAGQEFAKALEKKDFMIPRFAVYFNVTGRPEQDPRMIQEIMARQMTSPVLWVQLMERMWEDGLRRYVEVGPKGVLAKLAKQNLEPRGEPEIEAVGDVDAARALTADPDGE
jgi:[acyl-carrier-protein] S-malonyltransferase